MSAYELPNGNLMVRLRPGAPGPAWGTPEEEVEIGPDHPEWDRWYEIATNEAVETALRGVERYEREHSGGEDPRTGRRAAADAAIARSMLETIRKSIERAKPDPDRGD